MVVQHSHGQWCPTSGNRQVSWELRSEGTYNGNEMVVEDAKCNGHGRGIFKEISFKEVATSAGHVSRHSAVPCQRRTPLHTRTQAQTRTHTSAVRDGAFSQRTNAIEVPSFENTHAAAFAHAPQNKLSVFVEKCRWWCCGACDEDGVWRWCRRYPRREARWETRARMF